MKEKAKLDRVFAQFIRERDSKDGMFTCISCGKVKAVSQMNAGHYYSRRFMSLRYDEKNVNGQCVYCNNFQSGNIQGYSRGLIRKYGKDILELLAIRKSKTAKYTKWEYEALINEYKNKLQCT
jgi:hypothetical protein